MSPQAQQHEFAAETRQLLDLMVHSVYSNKDSFLRELISNASDALDKVRLAAYQDKDLVADVDDLHIELDVDAENRTLSVRDNGIGMSHDEVIDLIGTLAKSGTAELRQKLAEAKESAAPDELIGQFGIGFYSTFMVADKVTLVTRKAGEDNATRWESAGEGTYTIETLDSAPQGTTITLHLKPEDRDDQLHDYTQPAKLKELVKRYSDFIAWPIRMETTTEVDGEVSTTDETINSGKALWARPKSDVSDEEYQEFYRHVSHNWDEPLEIIPLKAEGTFEYQALLFIPSQAPFDLFMRESRTGLQLYVKRVFIMDNCEQLVPHYLRFITGVVDAQDLSLNVSREILQQDRQITAIRRRLTKKVLATIKDMQANDTAKYRDFWAQFGRALKEGLLSDYDNQETLLAVSSFESTHSESEPTTLVEYVDRMKDGQDAIYYLTGESRKQLEGSPHMEAFTERGLEVLLLTDPIDDMWVSSIPAFNDKPFQSIAKGEVDLDAVAADDDATAEDDEKKKDTEEQFAGVVTALKNALGDDVADVRLSHRLVSSPACLVGDTFSMSPQLEKLYRASGQPVPESKRILEINPQHPLVVALKDKVDDEALPETAKLLFGTAVLAEGGELSDPAGFAKVLTDRITRTL